MVGTTRSAGQPDRFRTMQLPEYMRSTMLRWTFLVAGLLAIFIVALLGFVYSETEDDLTTRSDRMITAQMDVFAAMNPEQRLDAINEHLSYDPRRVQLAGLRVTWRACHPILRSIARYKMRLSTE